MYYCKTRYYVPLWGRWLNADSPYNFTLGKIDGINTYSYCGNNPIIAYDKNGKFWFTFLSTVIGGIVGAVATMVSAACSGEDLTRKMAVSGFVGGAVSGFIFGITKGAFVGLASYASATAESIVKETWDYAFGSKELSGDNIMTSLINVAQDTVINGTINYASNGITCKIFPNLKTNKGWFIPKKFISFFTKSYGKKVIGGNLIGGIVTSGITLFNDKIEDIIEEFRDYIERRDPIKLFN